MGLIRYISKITRRRDVQSVFAKVRNEEITPCRISNQATAEALDHGIVRRSSSPWATPLHVVPKKIGSLRPVGDFHRLNLITIPDRHPMPHFQEFTAASRY